jgi:hypothetical protein
MAFVAAILENIGARRQVVSEKAGWSIQAAEIMWTTVVFWTRKQISALRQSYTSSRNPRIDETFRHARA